MTKINEKKLSRNSLENISEVNAQIERTFGLRGNKNRHVEHKMAHCTWMNLLTAPITELTLLADSEMYTYMLQ